MASAVAVAAVARHASFSSQKALPVATAPAHFGGRSASHPKVRRLAFTATDPFAPRQWYLTQIRAFDYWPVVPTTLAPVRVAIIDSGIDLGHPEFEGRVALAQSFVGGDASDRVGHGTFVAGLIGAALDNGQGIAGVAFPAQLVIAKVVATDGTISPGAEARAIRWAVDNGARVVNLSIGGLRDPRRLAQDTYSQVEQDAIAYAVRKHAVVVAAVGNGDQAPTTPWPYASYPAALPHVLGVSALAPDGSVPPFSNRDAIYNDIAAPGVGIVSTFPRALTALRPGCLDQGYSPCGPPEYQSGEGTSYAAALVSAAAALVLAARPDLAPDQVTALLERTAVDANAATGCRACPLLRDALSGWGRLDVTAALEALAGPLPPADRYEPNDDAGSRAYTLWGRSRQLTATLDFWDDAIDVYRIRLRKGQELTASLAGPPRTNTTLALWLPGTQHVEGFSPDLQRRRVAEATTPGPDEHVRYRAPTPGWYYLEVKLTTPGAGPYTLLVTKTQ
jgi:subtilisin family serine protease